MYLVTATTANGKTTVAKTKYSKPIQFRSVPYTFILRHKENPFLKKFYYGKNGMLMYTKEAQAIHQLEMEMAMIPVNELVNATIDIKHIDGRLKRYKKLPWYTVDMLVD